VLTENTAATALPTHFLQVWAGKQHHLGVTIDGILYEIAIGGEEVFAAAAASTAGRAPALTPGSVSRKLLPPSNTR